MTCLDVKQVLFNIFCYAGLPSARALTSSRVRPEYFAMSSKDSFPSLIIVNAFCLAVAGR